MLFHEIYGSYYSTVAKILTLAVEGELSEEKMNQIIRKTAFSESVLAIFPALKNQEWQLINDTLHTPLTHAPTLPLTNLQKRWLKTISLDKRILLFQVKTDELLTVPPLFTQDDYVVFDQYNNGDPFEDETYIQNFQTILYAIRQKRKLSIRYTTKKGTSRSIYCIPLKLEYSEKDNKFRLLTTGRRYDETINLCRIQSCESLEEYSNILPASHKKQKDFFVFELSEERNALERAMLHFAHFEKTAEKLSAKLYKVTVYYDHDDETELVIRVLSFGPLVKVCEPDHFVSLIKERLLLQKSCGLR